MVQYGDKTHMHHQIINLLIAQDLWLLLDMAADMDVHTVYNFQAKPPAYSKPLNLLVVCGWQSLIDTSDVVIWEYIDDANYLNNVRTLSIYLSISNVVHVV